MAAHLNSFNAIEGLPKQSDVVVVGGGIHALIYAIHARTIEMKEGNTGMLIVIHPLEPATNFTVLEKSDTPGYKIGESTLTVFGLWSKLIGIDSPMLWRLFGPKDGLAFYYFGHTDDPEKYTNFVANGPPGDFVPTLQIERKVSELMLTLFAQRLGITVLHGMVAIIDNETVHQEGGDKDTSLKVLDKESMVQEIIDTRLLIDATGRFHRFISKGKQRVQRPEGAEGFNTSAFWAYFDCPVDEKEIPLREYESVNTNHICVPEGWAWVIRLPTWEGTPLPNLTKMINYLLDLNAAKTPPDAYPSTAELVSMFDLKFRWVVSIGFALRSDVVYPSNISEYGSCEAAQKFSWVVSRYPKVCDFMKKFTLIKDLYGPGTTWYTRKNLAFRSPQVSGPNWMAIGDAVGFTNPLYSPGINANMATSIFVAEQTKEYLKAGDTRKDELLAKYENFCKDRVPNLQRMNVFNYKLMRSPLLGPIGPLFQYLIGTGNARFQGASKYTLDNCAELLTTWDWGANEPEYIHIADIICEILEGAADTPLSPAQLFLVEIVSQWGIKNTMATGKYKGRWSGLFRYYNDDLVFCKHKIDRDVLARRCDSCGEWRMLRPDALKCPFCGTEHNIKKCTKVLYSS
ncbi:uncharacterized protein LY89DRAFT_767260 [Mollisia scopiformis]|uniref:Uncharacterized protein n=1 Tax=Mollisia scopiformis TaxID=149040 RepID=A0A132B3H5_MOLSC|nr:uncharacterized protein LY89DRAFT_767260 [Mollisia scopiformis]KUJ06942.1 hypothetical protein LY89DRAFT_767260 [Mollisia scopiformis]